MKINRNYCPHRDDESKVVEFFWSIPECSEGKCPTIILVHGHNEGLRYGGRTDLFTGLFEFFVDNGFVTISMSQPGYGRSSGPADYCGRFSQRAVSSVLDYFEASDYIDSERIVLYGLSRGATVAGMTSSFDSRIKYQVLVAGLYNIKDGIDKLNDGIRESLEIESDNNNEAFFVRSPSLNVDKIGIPTLIIHGEKDEVAPFEYAEEFVNKGKKYGRDFTAHFFEKYAHGIPFSLCGELTLKFLRKHNAFNRQVLNPYILSFERS